MSTLFSFIKKLFYGYIAIVILLILKDVVLKDSTDNVFIIIAALLFFVWLFKRNSSSSQSTSSFGGEVSAGNHRYKNTIPKGFRIFFHEMEVAGTGYRKSAVRTFIANPESKLFLRHDPYNDHDSNAIMVMAEIDGILSKKEHHLGFIPRDLAKKIVSLGLHNQLLVRAKSAWVGDRGGLKLYIDLLGDKDDFDRLHQ
ncbi:HIRAN domain-containing protein [Vibrio sp. SCSIO 43136]|uniref:HIRAN domain-containing protein n=1 Tax=Vibrio sp. SCSIO 43136 TaxID=2819101 RepID=UPI0020759498|nr:HIRAN domain-containing protein [Vibrio sp. SCSIO 43136]USD68101.1 hypothetical protein J4N39_18170 [Vibrio sp. SCSIO 43136]